MTLAHRSPPLVVGDVDAAISVLRERGLRVSAARRLVLETLFAADGPRSAEQIADGVSGRVPRSDRASVYRNLETLEQLGLVRHVHLGHGPGLYQLVTGSEVEYLVCESCNAVRALPAPELDEVREAIRRTAGFEARFGHFPIVGLCPECAAQAAEDEG
jgi:Fur family transcriptional regulator, ferric uptake regulator